MSEVTFSCDISGPGADTALKLTIWCNGNPVAHFNPVTQHSFGYKFEDTAETQAHVIEFELSGKLPEYTQVDDRGNIVQDCLVNIRNKTFEDIDVDYAVDTHTVYHHDFNGHGPAVSETFCGIMGCNGRARFEFSTPIYLWMLEHV